MLSMNEDWATEDSLRDLSNIFSRPVQIQPMHDRILVKRTTSPRWGLIVLPDNVKVPKGVKGEVVAVGPGKRVDGIRRAVGVNPGDMIIFSPGGYTDWESGDQLYTLIQEADVVGVLSKDARVETHPVEFNDVVTS